MVFYKKRPFANVGIHAPDVAVSYKDKSANTAKYLNKLSEKKKKKADLI